MKNSDLPPSFFVDLSQYRSIKIIKKCEFYDLHLAEHMETKKLYYAFESTNKELFSIDKIGNVVKSKYTSIYIPTGFSEKNFQQQDYPTLLYDYKQNGTLESLFITSGFELNRDTRTYTVLLGTALAMRNLADNKSSHLQLTPENIFFDDDWFPLLLYFGKPFPTNQINTQLPNGKTFPLYTSPEVLAKKPFNYKVDTYSYGLIAYQIITGLVPYEEIFNESAEEFSEKVINGYRPDISMITSDSITDFLNWCWNPDPFERPSFYAIIDNIIHYPFSKIFDIDFKQIINYMNLYGNELSIAINIFQKNDPELDDDEIAYLMKETGRSLSEILHANEEIQNNPLDFSNNTKSFDELVTTMLCLNKRKRRTNEIYVYFTKKKQFDINFEIDKYCISSASFGSTPVNEEEEEETGIVANLGNESIAL